MRITLPLVTVGIPVKNRAWCIREVLHAIESIDYPKHLIKIVFVDDYSTDGTYEIITEWTRKAKEKGFYKIEVTRARTNIPQARNLCIKSLEGKYLLFWDSDVIPPLDLLKDMVEIMEQDPSIGVIGADYTYDQPLQVRYKPVTSKETNAVHMGFTLIRREVFEKVGEFNEFLSIGEDVEFCIRVKEQTNYRIIWASRPVLHLKRREDVREWNVLRWMHINFTIRARDYYKSFAKLPKFLKARIIYWLLYPWIAAMTIYLGLSNNILFPVLSLAYLSLSPALVVRHRGLINGLQIWIKNIFPSGLALSYGVAKEFFKNLISKSSVK